MSSYWSKRRRIRAAVDAHISDLALAAQNGTSNNLPVGCDAIKCEIATNTIEVGTEKSEKHSLANNNPNLCAPEFESGDNTLPATNATECDSWSECDTGESDSDSDLSSELEDECELSDVNLQDGLVNWAHDYNVSHAAIGGILRLLHRHHPSLPIDSRTLLMTPRSASVASVAGGVYHHVGIQTALIKLHESGLLPITDRISIQINIDGLPLFKSSGMQLWPILGIVKEPAVSVVDPFVIGVYAGMNKPSSCAEYLHEFVAEVKMLSHHGLLLSDKVAFLHLHSFVCDAPARAFLKCQVLYRLPWL